MDTILFAASPDTDHAIKERIRIESLHTQLSLLPLKMRLPLKLHFGLDLDLKELHTLTMQSGDPGNMALLLKKYRDKKERIRIHVYHTRDKAKADIFDYIEVFYNRIRRYTHLDGMSPETFEEVWRKQG